MKMSRIAFSASLLIGIAFLQASCSDSSGPDKVATTIVANSSTTVTTAPGAAVSERPSVIVSDQNNDPLAGIVVTFTVTSGGGSVTGANVKTDVNGVATVGSWILGSLEGPNTLTATAGNLQPVVFTANGVDPCVPAITYRVGTTTSGELTRADCDLGDGSFVDYYVFTLGTGGTVVFNETSSEFDAWLWLVAQTAGHLDLDDFDATLIGSNNNFGGSFNSRLKAILPAGTYIIGANSAAVNVVGKYALTSSADGGDVTNCEVVFLVKGSAGTQSLQTSDCTGSGSYQDLYLIHLTAGQAITVAMSSSAVDSYLAVYAPGNTTPLGQNDDKDTTTKDAQLAFTPPATGFYFIAATSVGVGATGPYSFTIQ